MRLKILLIVLVSLFFSCSHEKSCDNIDTSGITLDVNYQHLISDIEALNSHETVKAFLDKHTLVSRHILGRGSYPDSIFLHDMTDRFTNKDFKKLANTTKQAFGDYTSLEKETTDAFKRVKFYFPDYSLPSIITGITGFADNTQLVNLDTAVFISLDFFLGDDSPYQPNTFEYMKPFYRKEMITRSIIFAKVGPDLLKTKQMKEENNGVPLPVLNNNVTLLDEMITFGRLLYFTQRTLNCPDDSIVTGFTTHELTILRENKKMLWEHFIKNELLYKTDHMIKVKYMEPRPFTNEISQECPGRLGQWFGYQIVKQYMEKNPEVTLPELMNETDDQKIFGKSKFRP